MTTTNRTLPGTYRGYQIEEGDRPDGTKCILIFTSEGGLIDWVLQTGPEGIAAAHRQVDEWQFAK